MDSFIVALDQYGDSVYKTLSSYGVNFNLNNKDKIINDFKKRIIMSDCLNNDKIFGVILSKDMIDEKIGNINVIDYLKNKGIKSFVKIDLGLSEEIDGVKVMNNIPHLEYIIDEVLKKGSYGTKMRSLILKDDRKGIKNVLNQQFLLAKKIYLSGLIPIIEPEVSIYSENKEKCENILKE